jgi:hypothetical protein
MIMIFLAHYCQQISGKVKSIDPVHFSYGYQIESKRFARTNGSTPHARFTVAASLSGASNTASPDVGNNDDLEVEPRNVVVEGVLLNCAPTKNRIEGTYRRVP